MFQRQFETKQKIQFTNPSKPLLSLLKIYTVNKIIKNEKIFTSFTRDSIQLIAYYLYTQIARIMIKIKNLLSLQRRTIPNILHFIVLSNLKFEDFYQYLLKKYQENLEGRVKNIQEKSQMTKLMGQLNLFQLEIPQNQIPSIYNIPNFCLIKNNLKNPFPLRICLSQCIPKPPLVYRNIQSEFLKSNIHIDPIQSEKRRMDIEKEYRIMQGRKARNSFQLQNEKKEQPNKKIIVKSLAKFNICSYI